MNRKPRHKKKDRLVNKPLAVYSYLHIGMMRACPVTQGTTHSQSEAVLFLVGCGWGGRRNHEKNEDRAVLKSLWNLRLTLIPSGIMQSLGAFLVYFTVYAQEGFRPTTLINLRVEWEKDSVNNLEDSYGQEWVRRGSAFSVLLLLPSWCCPAQADTELRFPWMAVVTQRRWTFSKLTGLLGPEVTLLWPLLGLTSCLEFDA